ncbi:MAG: alkaline phosphatase family protein [Anaerolineales bacterium]|nr:alkaline phosphatase family protein [Anaerolineales bacterium]
MKSPHPPQIDPRRLLIIALDGATWDLIDTWIANGQLPNIARLVAGGVSATLESTIPPITPVAWLTFATGKNPAQYHVFDFFRPLRTSYTDLIPTTADLNQEPMLWEILSQRGRHVGIVNIPMTFPTRPVNGFVIPGIPTPACADPGFPPGLVNELREKGWDLTRNAAIPHNSFRETLDYLHDLVQTRIEATCYLVNHKPWDLFVVHFLETDQAEHTFWRFLDQEDSPFQEAILQIYQHIDRGIGQMLDAAGEAAVILMSDHGMGPTHYHINLNNWLIQEKFMHWRNRLSTHLRRGAYKLGLNPTTIYRWLPPEITRRLTLGELRTGIAQITTEHVGRRGSNIQQIAARFSKAAFLSFNDVDWTRTVAYSTGTTGVGLIYLNVQGREPAGVVAPEEYAAWREKIAQQVAAFVDPCTKRPLVKRVYTREELFHGPYIEEAPDLVVTYHYGEYDQKKGAAFLSTRPVEPVRNANATHRMEGIFVLHAPHVAREGTRIPHIHIQDIAATALHLLGEPIPREMESHVLSEGWTASFQASHPVQISDSPLHRQSPSPELSPEDLENVLKRLHDLGYIA